MFPSNLMSKRDSSTDASTNAMESLAEAYQVVGVANPNKIENADLNIFCLQPEDTTLYGSWCWTPLARTAQKLRQPNNRYAKSGANVQRCRSDHYRQKQGSWPHSRMPAIKAQMNSFLACECMRYAIFLGYKMLYKILLSASILACPDRLSWQKCNPNATYSRSK